MYSLFANLNKRINIIIYGICLSLIIIVTRLFYLQINLMEHFFTRGEKNFLRIETTRSLRGNILDCTGKLIATNRPVTDLYWQGSGKYSITDDQKQALEKIEAILGKTIINNQQIIYSINSAEKQCKSVLIGKDLSYKQLSKIQEQLSTNSNISVKINFQRYYPYGPIASHILGYLSRPIDIEPYGQMGLEKIGEAMLRGQEGSILKTINSLGRDIGEIQLKESLAGNNIQTTIDIQLQEICEKVFPTKYAGAFILMNPLDGSILSVASRPNFDPNIFLAPISNKTWLSLQEKQPFLNRAFDACYPPGSIFKLITISAALEHNIISTDSTWNCKGFVSFAGRKYWCARRYGHGELTATQALAQSCNTLFFEIGKQININLIKEYAEKFGLGLKTNMLFPEKTGIIPSHIWKLENKGESWWPGETLSVAIGQSFLLTTPIQVARMISSIFTGYLVKPRIITSESVEAIPLDIKPETINFLQKSMKFVVTRGTGKRISTVKDIKIYAKTSTAQTSAFEMRHLGQDYLEHAWCVVYFQYKENDPFTAVILVENAGTSQVATAIARNFLVEYKKLIDQKED